MKKTIKIIILIISAFMAVIYLLPYFANHILNIGSIFGIALNAAIFLCTLLSKQLSYLIKKICSSNIGKSVFVTFVSLVSVFLIAFSGTFLFVFFGGHTTAADQNTIIVLGCLVKGDVPSAQLRWRIDAAEKYLEEHQDAVAVLSGGKGERENISEAECMFNEMVKDGIDPKRLYIEDNSTDTWENIAFSAKTISENGLSNNIAIVSNNYHVSRAKLIAEKNAFENVGKISAYSDPTPVFYTREVFGIWWTLLGLYR